MCVVTWLPYLDGSCVLTTNRDISLSRAHSHPPENHNSLAYPLDPIGKGSWIAISKSTIVCLLNAQSINTGKKFDSSRGGFVLELCTRSVESVNAELLVNYDAFQLIKADVPEQKLTHFDWNGSDLKVMEIEWTNPRLWASNTLYDEKVKKAKEERFNQFLENEALSTDSILKFHDSEKIDREHDLRNPLDQQILTTSITQVRMNLSKAEIIYTDLLNNSIHRLNI